MICHSIHRALQPIYKDGEGQHDDVTITSLLQCTEKKGFISLLSFLLCQVWWHNQRNCSRLFYKVVTVWKLNHIAKTFPDMVKTLQFVEFHKLNIEDRDLKLYYLFKYFSFKCRKKDSCIIYLLAPSTSRDYGFTSRVNLHICIFFYNCFSIYSRGSMYIEDCYLHPVVVRIDEFPHPSRNQWLLLINTIHPCFYMIELL